MNGKEVPFINTGKQIQFIKTFTKGENSLFRVQHKPKTSFYILGSEDTNDVQIWTR
jgi:aminopeptidase N